MLFIAGLVLIATAAIIAAFDLGHRAAEDAAPLPCAFCGKILVAPLYACKHYLGDGRAIPQPTPLHPALAHLANLANADTAKVA